MAKGLPVFRSVQNGKEIFVGVLSSKQLMDERLDVRAWFSGSGYQRLRNDQKIEAIADFLTKYKGIMPPSVLIGIRDPMVKYVGDNRSGLLKVPPKTKMFVVDGQHRIWGYRRLRERQDKVGEFSLPAVFLCPTIWDKKLKPDVEEGKQFITINKTQSKVKKELVDAFVYSLADPVTIVPRYDLNGVSEDIRKEMRRRIRARAVAMIMSRWPAWKGRVREPNRPRKNTVIGITALVDTLATDVVEQKDYRDRVPGDIAKDLEHYWEAILSVYPSAESEPRRYWVQKLLGISVFHKLFPYVDAVAKNKSVKGFVHVLRGRARLLPERYWGPEGKAKESGTSYVTRDKVAARMWRGYKLRRKASED